MGCGAVDAKPSRPNAVGAPLNRRLPHLFSDLSQWMIKVLIGQEFPESLRNLPRGDFRAPTQLAAAEGVSVMTANRFVSSLAHEGFLGRRQDGLRIVRIFELLDHWTEFNRRGGENDWHIGPCRRMSSSSMRR